jgi:hypothetical protein
MFHSPWMYFETGYSCAPHFKTFVGFVCFFHFESVLKLGSHVHLTSKHSIGSVLDSMASFDIFVSSGGMGGSLNHFCWGILVFDPPRYHSHPIECTLALCWEPLIQPHEIFTPKLCWEKNHSLAAAVELSVTLRVVVFPRWGSWSLFSFWRI